MSHLCVFEDHQICVVVSNEELKMELNRHFTAENLDHFGVLVLWLVLLLKKGRQAGSVKIQNNRNLIKHCHIAYSLNSDDQRQPWQIRKIRCCGHNYHICSFSSRRAASLVPRLHGVTETQHPQSQSTGETAVVTLSNEPITIRKESIYLLTADIKNI